MKKLYYLFLSLILLNVSYSQCPIINSAMVNSCGASEGINEFVIFTTTASATTSSYTLHYGSANPPSSGTAKLLGSNATTKTGPGTITSSLCTINEVTSPATVIPANSIVIFIPSDFETQYDVSALCGSGSIYVVYINRAGTWQPGGNLANNSGSSDRYLQVSNGANACTSGVRTYNFGWPVDTDGNAISWNAAGTPTYVNNGCTVIPPPPGVTITPSSPISVCNNATSATFNYSATGSPDKYSLDWNAAANAVGFVDVSNAPLPPSSFNISFPAGTVVGTTYTGSLTATNTTSGLTSAPQSISVTVIGKPVVPNIIGPTSLCEGYTYYSLQNTVPDGVWNSTTPTIATIDNIGAVTGVSAGTAILTYTVTNTCGSTVSAPFSMAILSLPVVADISGLSNICTGSSATFTNATPGGSWTSSNSSIASVSSSGTVTGSIPGGPVTITYTVSNACGSVSKTFQVTVGNSPFVADINGVTSVCAGATTTLSNATTGGTWSSSNTALATINNSGTVTGIAAGGPITITYTVTTGCGTVSKTLNITVVDKPAIPAAIAGNANICETSTTILTNATTGGVWSSSNTAAATINSSGVVTAVAVGQSTITYTVGNSCGSTASLPFAITITGKPTVADIAGSPSLCVGATTTLTSATGGGTWSSGNTTVATVNSITGVVTGVAIGGPVTITYTVTNTCGSTSKTFQVTVGDSPFVADISGSTSVCAGANTTLSNATTGGIWSSDNTTVATVGATGIVTGVAQGTATITYTVSSSCGTTSKSFSITINDKPAMPAVIIGTASICEITTTTLTDATAGGVWSSSNTAAATINNSGVVTGVAIGQSTITYTVSNICGSTASLPFIITITGKPVVADITGSSNICVGTTTALTSATGGGSWSSGNTAIATVDATTGTVTGVATGGPVTITYTVTNTCGSTSKTFQVTVGNAPVVANISGTPTLCAGTTTALSNTTAGGTWSSSNTTIATVNTMGIVTGVAQGTATISYRISSSCGSVAKTINITVTDKPALPANITGSSSICVGTGTTLSKATVGGTWQSSNPSVATINTSGAVTSVSTGQTTITYVVSNGCGSTSSNPFTLTVNGVPSVPDITGPTTVNIPATITLSNTTSGGTWSSSNTAIATVNNSGVVTGVSVGKDTIIYTVTNSCGTVIKKYPIVVLLPLIEDVFIPNAFTPNGDGNNDFLQVYGNTIVGLEMKIFNQWGELIFSMNDVSSKWDGFHKGKQQPVGVYIYAAKVRLQSGNTITKKGSINLIR